MGGLSNKGYIGEGGDFDSKTEQGIYSIGWGTRAYNHPGIDWGLLIVFKTTFIIQIAVGALNNTSKTIMRSRYSDTGTIKFSDWS